MQGPEDDAGLAGKMALISGGGAAATASATAALQQFCWPAQVQKCWWPTAA
ncbi:hypothetical protein [Bradyrhizobium sp. CCBAU 11361]|uniref:hypothetical protein n=1 Tax=Bradyrhizobium sp. CCBAU 11361 TaxID=1630812 RepID=UPI002306B466|nr:hypothetical protein [Bradyrhizobium sp. CCBAU 11361]